MPRLQTMLGLVATAALLIASAPTLVHAGNPAAPASADGVPRGQMVRRALSGTVAGVGGGSIDVQTNFGIVTVGIGGAVIRAPGQEDFTAADIQVGDRVAVLLDRPPVDPDSLPPDDDPESTATPTGGASATSTPPTLDDLTVTPTATAEGGTSATSTPQAGDETTVTPTATVEGGTSATSTSPTATPEPTPSPSPTPEPAPSPTPAASPTPTQVTGEGTDGTVSATSTPPVINETPVSPSATSTPTVSPGQGVEPSATSTPPSEPTATPTATVQTPKPLPTVVIRSVNALRVTVVPANPLRTHLRGVVGEKGNGRVKLLKGSGEEEDLAWEGEGPEVGSDVIVVAQRGPSGGPRQVSATSTPDAVSERLERLQEKLADKQDALAEKLAEMNQARNEKRIERLEATRGNAPANVQDKIDQHISGARGGRGRAGQTDDEPDASDQDPDGGAGDSDQSAGPGNSNKGQDSGSSTSNQGQSGGSSDSNQNQGGAKGRNK